MLWIDKDGHVWETTRTKVGVTLARRCDLVLSPIESGYGDWQIVTVETVGHLGFRVP
jgi:hypothetical protein